MTMRDVAGWYLEALDDLGWGPLPVLGYGLGGWLAAEMAVMCPQQFSKLIVSGAPGIKPPTGEIFDMFMVVAKDYIAKSFYDAARSAPYQDLFDSDATLAQLEQWECAREEASRLTWLA